MAPAVSVRHVYSIRAMALSGGKDERMSQGIVTSAVSDANRGMILYGVWGKGSNPILGSR
jgi:hypothetical protein